MSQESPRTLRFGEFVIDVAASELRHNGEPVNLPPQPVRVLALLAARPGTVVTRKEIEQEIWGQDTHVDFAQGLNYCIRQIRLALSDDASCPRYIETLPRRGYRFLGKLEPEPLPAEHARARIMFVVLPFENLGHDPEQEYFSDGLTDEMINELGRACPDQLGVIARTSAMKYKRADVAIEQIGRELGVEFALEGTVRRSGDRVRIGVRLIKASDQAQIWADSYDTDLRDILAIQRDVARNVAGQVQLKLIADPSGCCPSPRPPVSPAAYEAYLKGRHLWHGRTAAGLRQSIRFFEEAIAHDAGYAEAYAGLADAHLTLLDYDIDPQEAMANSACAVATSLSLNDSLAEAHTSLAHASMHQLDWRVADRAFRRTFELNPSYAPAHFFYANYLIACTRFAEALEAARRAVELDPVSAIAEANVGFAALHAGAHGEAERRLNRALELDPQLWVPQFDLARLYEDRGDYESAARQFRKIVERSNRSPRTVAALGRALALDGNAEEAKTILASLEQLSRETHVSAYNLALLCSALGESDRAFEYLETAFARRDGEIIFVRTDHRTRELREDDRFRSIEQRMMFPA